MKIFSKPKSWFGKYVAILSLLVLVTIIAKLAVMEFGEEINTKPLVILIVLYYLPLAGITLSVSYDMVSKLVYAIIHKFIRPPRLSYEQLWNAKVIAHEVGRDLIRDDEDFLIMKMKYPNFIGVWVTSKKSGREVDFYVRKLGE